MAKIVVVEDDPMLGEIYNNKFADAGFEMKLVTSGKAVQIEVENFQPDMVLLDIVLPDMDGYEILQALSKSDASRSIPVYIFSNLSAKEDIDRATSLGAKGFLTKSSFTPSQLVEEVKKIVGGAPTVPEQQANPSLKPHFSPAAQKMPAAKEPNNRKVLIIEDEDVFIEMFGEKLKQEGFEVVSAKNGKWGIKEAEGGGFDCVLLDMMMPEMNGLEAVKELRATEKSKNTPIIILSNSALDSEVQQALALGANEYYIKTKVTPGEVAEKVKELTK
ncbi:MAG TPA: response regulator [Candidatus Bathyarchaeia archaeon]|nr:response regulator [Candidatus Bathyarchaeia archaeon]